MSFIYNILGGLLKFCYQISHNYLVALLLIALVMQIILLPLGIKQQKNMVKQARLSPKVAAIRKKYAGRTDKVSQQKLQQETMELYQKEGYNQLGGCLPLVIQLPILIFLYNVIIHPLQYISKLGGEAINILTNGFGSSTEVALAGSLYNADSAEILTKAQNGIAQLAEKGTEVTLTAQQVADEVGDSLIPNLNAFGSTFNLSITPWDGKGWLLLVPVLTFVAMFISQKITKKFSYRAPETEQMQNAPTMKIMEYLLPLLSVWISFRFAAAIGIYWIFRNLLSMGQQIALAKALPYPQFTQEDFRQAEREMKNGKGANGMPMRDVTPNPNVRSLHHIDDEENEAPTSAPVQQIPAQSKKIPPAPLKKDKDGKDDGKDK